MHVLVLHGPNLNLLGEREPEVYGSLCFSDLCINIQCHADKLGFGLYQHQSNHEGQLVDWLQLYRNKVSAVVINPGAYTHTSIALRDAFLAIGLPFIEVHLSNIYARESFRHQSYLSDIALGQIVGLGPSGYLLALTSLAERLNQS